MPDLYIIAGPNGAGKTTTAVTLLPDFLSCVEYVNADNIARGISPFNPESVAFQAGRVMLHRMKELVEKGMDFAFETTLSAKSYASFFKFCKLHGYDITLIFIYLDSFETAKERVKSRVQKGGHSIPEKIIENRYKKGLINLRNIFINLSDAVIIFNNSGIEPVLISEFIDDHWMIHDTKVHKQIFT